MRNRADPERNQLYDQAHPLLFAGKDRAYPADAVPFQKLYETIPLWRRSHYESLELSFPSHNGTSGGRYFCRKYGSFKAKRLFPHTSALIQNIISECFDEAYVSVITGGRAENTYLLTEHFDYIFFTGSQSVGKEVMKQASAHLTPVTLELGGKSPCIVEKSANIKLAAKRIVFGKFLNCGQTCVAPDYIYCDASVKDRLLAEIKKQICLSSEMPLWKMKIMEK